MMTSLKTWCLLPLAVLLMSITHTLTEVVQSMSDCKEFLLEEKTPEVPDILKDGKVVDQNRYKTICQTYKNDKRFVTLYDTQNKIPVFSAYKYRGEGNSEEDKKRPKKAHWKIEPQLENVKNDKNMMNEKTTMTVNHQASNRDYKNQQGYDRGHLFPSSHAFNKTDKISTFTLTNIVPQAKSFNGGSWNKMENCVKCIMTKYCINNNKVIEGYVVTGALSSTDPKLNGINIPSTLWSAFCCYSHSMNKWIASAHWGRNVQDVPKYQISAKTLDELQTNLHINVFPNTKCPPSTTVTEFYKDVDRQCMCPSS